MFVKKTFLKGQIETKNIKRENIVCIIYKKKKKIEQIGKA